MSEQIDTVLFWETAECCEINKCRIRVYWVTWEKAVVIATDITNRPGGKIADVTQKIVSFVSLLYKIAPNKLMLIEHYSKNNLDYRELYLQLLIFNNEATRYEVDKCQLTQLVGQPI